MSTTGLLLSLLFGSIGMRYLLYGKGMSQFIPMGVGLALMLVP